MMHFGEQLGTWLGQKRVHSSFNLQGTLTGKRQRRKPGYLQFRRTIPGVDLRSKFRRNWRCEAIAKHTPIVRGSTNIQHGEVQTGDRLLEATEAIATGPCLLRPDTSVGTLVNKSVYPVMMSQQGKHLRCPRLAGELEENVPKDAFWKRPAPSVRSFGVSL